MTSIRIDGATALVTGASSGLGREFARLLAHRVRALVLFARREERLEALRDEFAQEHPGLVVHIEAVDLAKLDQAERALTRAVEKVGPIDLLINNAGSGDVGMFDLQPIERTMAMMHINMDALVMLTRKVLPDMIERGRGGILNVSSGFGLEFMPGFSAYVGTKHFVTGFTESLRSEVQSAGVVVSQVCPGPIATEFAAASIDFALEERPPAWIEMNATDCAKWTLKRFRRGQALIIPGVLMNLVLGVGAVTPRVVKRVIYPTLARALRKKQLAAAPKESPAAKLPDSRKLKAVPLRRA